MSGKRAVRKRLDPSSEALELAGLLKKRLKELKDGSGKPLTMSALAREIDYDVGSLSRLLRGLKSLGDIKIDTWQKISKVLEIPVEDLIQKFGQKKSKPTRTEPLALDYLLSQPDLLEITKTQARDASRCFRRRDRDFWDRYIQQLAILNAWSTEVDLPAPDDESAAHSAVITLPSAKKKTLPPPAAGDK